MSFSDPGQNLLNQFIIGWLSVLLLTDKATAHFTSKKLGGVPRSIVHDRGERSY